MVFPFLLLVSASAPVAASRTPPAAMADFSMKSLRSIYPVLLDAKIAIISHIRVCRCAGEQILIRVNFSKTFHKTRGLVTFSEICDKTLSQKVIL
jgi:hypothetical protein